MEKNDNLTFLGGLGTGLAVMYLVDPARGRRRRHLIRDRAVHAAHRLSDGIGTTSRDLKHRTSGLVAEAGRIAGERRSRLLTTLAGGALTVYGARRKDPIGAGLAVAGAGLLARAATNLETRRLTGVGAKRRAVDVQRTVTVAVPIERAFQFWSNYENFPAFMSHVREVRALGDGRSKWVIEGPAGVSVEWVAEETERVPNEVIAWRTQEGSAIGHAGIVRFAPTNDGGTRIDLKMSYNPPAGALGYAVLSLFGSNPRQRMIDDLARMKTALETGVPPRDAAAPLADMPPIEREVVPGRVAPPGGGEPLAEAPSVVP